MMDIKQQKDEEKNTEKYEEIFVARWNKFSDWVKGNGGLFAVLTTIISVCINFLYKGCAYLYHKGRYDYWNIPDEYMIVNYETTLFGFVVTIASVVVGFLLIYLHGCAIYIIQCNNKKIKKYLYMFLLIIFVPIIFLLLLFVYLVSQSSLEIAILCLKMYPFDFAPHIIVFSLLYYLLLFTVKPKKKTMNDTDCKESRKHSENKIGKWIAIMSIIIGAFIVGYNIYSIGLTGMDLVEEVSVVNVEEKEYVIVEKYNDYWVVKECVEFDELLYINKEHYMLMDISQHDIYIMQLEGGRTIEACMLSESNYREVVNNKGVE